MTLNSLHTLTYPNGNSIHWCTGWIHWYSIQIARVCVIASVLMSSICLSARSVWPHVQHCCTSATQPLLQLFSARPPPPLYPLSAERLQNLPRLFPLLNARTKAGRSRCECERAPRITYIEHAIVMSDVTTAHRPVAT